ncbi:hypothetical protein Tco_0636055 [Tanacetum coccineum]
MPAKPEQRAFGLTSLVRPKGLAKPMANFFHRQLRIVLSIDDKLNLLDRPLVHSSLHPVASCVHKLLLKILAAHTAWVKGSKEIADIRAALARHWKRNCPQYLAELLKKKKNTASGAGGGSEDVLALMLRSLRTKQADPTESCRSSLDYCQDILNTRNTKDMVSSLHGGDLKRDSGFLLQLMQEL